MTDQIIFNSQEIEEVSKTLIESLQVIDTNIKKSLSTDFITLSELDFYTDGLKNLVAETENLYIANKNLLEKLQKHNDSMITTEDSLNKYVVDSLDRRDYSYSDYNGSTRTHDGISVSSVGKGQSIEDKPLEKIVTELDFNTQLKILSIFTASNSSVGGLLLREENSVILSNFLKKMFKKENDGIKVTPEFSNNIQKLLLESLAKNENNIFVSLEDKTILSGLPYFKSIAKSNNLTISEFLLDEKNNKIFLKSVSDIYNNNLSNSGITEKEINNVKLYLNNLSKKLNVSVDTLITDERYINFVKQGVSE